MITVWGRDNSTNVKKVVRCLEELARPYNVIPAGGKFGINNTPEYLAMNPNGLVPCLRDEESGMVLWESNTIVRYLAAQYGQSRLWIDAPAARAQAEKWMDWSGATLAPSHRKILMGLVRTPPAQRNQSEIDQGIEECNGLFTLLDNTLASQDWLSGEAFGVGDIAVAPYIWNLFNCGVSWPSYPHLERWYAQLAERPAYQKVVMIPVS